MSERHPLEELASLPTFHHPTASPSGDRVAFYYDVSGRNELHVLDVETGESRQVSDSEAQSSSSDRTESGDGQVPRNARWHLNWSADGDRVYFHLDDAGDEQNDVHAMDLDGNAEPLVELDGQNVLSDVGDDGDTLLVASSTGGQMNLHVHRRSTGETERITDYGRAVGGGELSPDCERVAYATNESDDYDNQDVYVSEVDGSNPRNLHVGGEGAEASPAAWHPDGDALLVSDNTADLGRVGLYDLSADEVTWYGDGEHEESPVTFLPDGERFLALRTRRAAVMPVVYDAETGEHTELDLPEGVASFPRAGDPVLGDDRVLVVHTTPSSRPELLAYDLASGKTETLVEADYGDIDPDAFADAEYFTFESDGVPDAPARAVDHDPYDDLEIGALLYDSGERPAPLIVNPHGGPRAADYRGFDLYTQFLVSRGYSVLKVNYRGSTGRGREFVEELYDDWGGAEQGDVAVGVEHVARTREWIDEDRIAVFGGSYGGYSAYWQLVQYPDLYDAGVAWIGVTDLVDMFENTMPHFRTELMEKYLGTPEENPALYEERSPASHADNLSAPLLVVHGVNDRRVPVSQARIFRDALDEAGFSEGEEGDYEYVELGEEGHASSDIDQKIRMLRTLEEFLERRMPARAEATADD